MDLQNLKTDELRAMGLPTLKETEFDVRKSLNLLRMNVNEPDSTKASKRRGLKKTLARIKTLQTELRKVNK